MRSEFCHTLISIAKNRPMVFLTGDLGFMALEPLQEALGNCFINSGIAEQNMVSVAAGLTLAGLQTWVYSIAPFCYARPFEQIRNDACLNRLPVKFVGNGGGYAYGSMGSTHHALEDYGVLLSLQSMRVFVPAFSLDLAPIIAKMTLSTEANYLRLGKCELPSELILPEYRAWRCLLRGNGALLVCIGPLVGPLIKAFQAMPYHLRPEIWLVTELPLTMQSIPNDFLQKLVSASTLCVVEEHVAQGGLGQNLVWLLQKNDIKIPAFLHAHAHGYPSGRYGSQAFHRAECGLDLVSIARMLNLKMDVDVAI